MISAGRIHKLPIRRGPPLSDPDSHYDAETQGLLDTVICRFLGVAEGGA